MVQDVSPLWLKLARRCQSVFGGNRSDRLPAGFAVMTVRVLVAPDGQPVFWSQPEVTHFEPADRAQLFLYQVMEKMAESG